MKKYLNLKKQFKMKNALIAVVFYMIVIWSIFFLGYHPPIYVHLLYIVLVIGALIYIRKRKSIFDRRNTK